MNILKNPISAILRNRYEREIDKARVELSRLPIEKAIVEVDFKSLGVTSQLEEYRLYLNPSDEGLSLQLYAWRLREPLNTFFLYKSIRDKKQNIDVVMDVGSNIGYFPLCEVITGVKNIIAIEPVPESYAILRRNMKCFKNVKLLNFAISHSDGPIKMYVPRKLNLASVHINEEYLNNAGTKIDKIIDVRGYSFDSVLKRENLKGLNILVRMDIEGFEKAIINQLPKEVYGISFELYSYILGYSDNVALIKKLMSSGYKIELMLRELDGLVPIVRLLGLKTSLRLYESLIEKRVFHEPSMNDVESIIRLCRENPHIFAFKS